MGKTNEPISLTPAQRKAMERLVARPTASYGHARRARVILLGADGVPGVEIARRLGLTEPAVARIRSRFWKGGVKGLADRPKPGRGNSLAPVVVQKIISTALSRPPAGYSHWSTLQLARELRIGKSTVHKILRANNVKPHLTRTFKVSKDPKFDEKATDVVGLYLNPPDNAVVLSVDEKTSVQALERTQPMLPLTEGQIRRHTHDYKRNGVVDLYAALNVATGCVTGKCTDTHTGADFLAFMQKLAQEYPDKDLHVILDNSSTHKTPDVMAWKALHPRITFHFTPTSASWLNQVEGFFSILTRRSLRQTSFVSRGALKKHLRDFLAAWNANPTPFVWTKSAHKIVRDHRKMLDRISREEH
jgi:transposase/DNA-binding CsgD family transcriptional regulator